MPTLTYLIDIDPTKFRYLTQDRDGEVYAHVNVHCRTGSLEMF